ncbi:hypothetical protein [Luteimonas sp. FCS-9]|uniref:hypothetical protein n=1 Tax=Luteimonas sp. FCS-9 TaxID=1547516 RepID=UPI00063E912A|nr:hypothetical protein [Luteimonas sp. FCS-9]KLJ02539.1 hypothetical protein WQ56_03210 [Luteimonas sp. FCS-9]
MDWQTDPLLREECDAPAPWPATMPHAYRWSACDGVALLTWRGQAVGAVYPNGRYWLRWRRREHAGTAASPAQARRFMTRWLHARRDAAPVLDDDSPPRTLVPLETFLREYEDAVD